MELRYKFNENEFNYDRARPGYPDDLYCEIAKYAGLKKGDNAIEIGIGTGQATLPFLDMGISVKAVEIGDRLAAFVKDKYSGKENFSVICADFLDAELEKNFFDIVYSATAFHWLDQDLAYKKVLKCLRPGGTAALFWNHPYPNKLDDKTNIANRRVYDKHRPGGKPVKEFEQADCVLRAKAMEAAGFCNVEYKLFKRVRSLTTKEYIALINTYSDHLALTEEKRLAFETDMIKAIDEVGGKINIYDTIDLYLGRKM